MRREIFSDSEIIQGIHLQRSDVLLYLYSKNYRIVKDLIEKSTGSETEAEDIFQDALIILFNKIRNNELQLTSSIHTYLIAIAKNLWYHILAKKKKVFFEEITDYKESENFFDAMLILERKKIFVQHFFELSEGCQKLIKLYIKHTLIQDITITMGYSSEQFTRNKKTRCKQSLLNKILKNPYFKNVSNERSGKSDLLP